MAEVDTARVSPDDLGDLAERVRRSVAEEFQLPELGVALIRKGTLPRTTSGKVQRSLTRSLLADDRLATVLHARIRTGGSTVTTAGRAALVEIPTVRASRTIVREFERFLGDPRDAASVIPADRSVELDERREFPVDAIAAVNERGLQRWYVPEAQGGELRDFLVPMMMIRSIARRDLTVAVAHGVTFLGAVGAWITGGPIADTMAELVLDGGPVSWGLTERGRGSDLSNTATTAALGDRVVLDGEKWPINNATRGRAMTVLARTSDQPGPRSLSLVLLDKHRVESGTLAYAPEGRHARHARCRHQRARDAPHGPRPRDARG